MSGDNPSSTPSSIQTSTPPWARELTQTRRVTTPPSCDVTPKAASSAINSKVINSGVVGSGDLDAEAPGAADSSIKSSSMSPGALSVSELTTRIKNQLEMTYPTLAVQGELSNFKRQSSGHLYFSLKDEGAQIQVALFQSAAQKINFEPRDGDQVLVRGQLTVYSQRGQYQLVARHLEKVGMGEILLRLEALKRELKTLGWMDQARKKPIPAMPKCIGVVSSPTGAVIRDILHVLRLRHPGFHLLLYPARVQGATAAEEVAAGIRFFNQHLLCDVIIVARGGGSFEDLMPFNEKPLLEAVYQSQIPIISAVGHETDFTLCDFIADLRAPTPSAAAERVLPAKSGLQEKLQFLSTSIHRRLQSILESSRSQLHRIKRHPRISDPTSLIDLSRQRIDELYSQVEIRARSDVRRHGAHLETIASQASPYILFTLIERTQHKLRSHSNQMSMRLQQLYHRSQTLLKASYEQIDRGLNQCLQSATSRLTRVQASQSMRVLKEHLSRYQIRFQGIQDTLVALSPQSAMRRGYAILRGHQGQPIQKVGQLISGEVVEIELQDGKLWSLVQRIEFKSPPPIP